GSTRVNKDQHNSANPTTKLVTGELKQYGRSEFDNTTATENSWEPRGVLQLEQKIKDSVKGEEMQPAAASPRTRLRRQHEVTARFLDLPVNVPRSQHLLQAPTKDPQASMCTQVGLCGGIED
ncbi:hypothetical protein BHM03_00048535, partial [Ensete ventricosum]